MILRIFQSLDGCWVYGQSVRGAEDSFGRPELRVIADEIKIYT